MNDDLDIKLYGKLEKDSFLTWTGNNWENFQYMDKNWQEVLEEVPIEEIERFLRKKKIENIEREI